MSTLRKSLVTALAAATLLGLSPVVGYSDAEAQFRRPPPGGGMRPGPAPRRSGGGGGAAAGAAFGILAGALIGSAMEQQRQQEYQRQRVYVPPAYDDDAVEYCMSRYRSYDPRTGTYRGFDGRLYRCP